MKVEILTPRYAASWPERFCYREMLVHRPAAAPRSDWSIGRYVRHLTTWVKQNAKTFDAIIVHSIGEEVTAVMDALHSSIATNQSVASIVVSSGWGQSSDLVSLHQSRAGKRALNSAKSADKIVCKSAATQRLLIGQGVSPQAVERIDIGFGNLPHDDETRREVRERLGFTNSDLATSESSKVVLVSGRMVGDPIRDDTGMDLIARAARHLSARYDDIHFWFHGDGPCRAALYDYLKSEGLRNSIAMPGTFADVTDLMLAADVFVGGDDQGLDHIVPLAVSADIPLVAIDSPSFRTLLTTPTSHDSSIQWCSASTAKAIRIAIQDVLDDLPSARDKASKLRRELIRARPQSHVIEQYTQLLTSIVRGRTGRNVRQGQTTVRSEITA